MKIALLLIEEHILDVRYAFTAVLTKPTPVVYVNVSQGHSDNKEFQFNNTTVCTIGKEWSLPFGTRETKLSGSKEVQYQCVECAILSDREDVSVIAELPLTDSQQFLEDRTDLLVIGEITFNKHLYEGLKEENHKAEITVILLKMQVINSLPVVIGSSVGGFLLLAFIIFILFKCGFFKRNYKNMMVDMIPEDQND
ncbi:integrin alpha-E isoform X2 [Natator depressus]|uniref:integrin alpha-E isoform X2 n=1 Tax=Natator depressus TaxID=27790 RepID=UPI003EB98471